MTIFERLSEIKTRMNEIKDVVTKEKRKRNESEDVEWNNLLQEREVLTMEAQCQRNVEQKGVATAARMFDEAVRGLMKEGLDACNRGVDIRAVMDTTAASAGGTVPLTIGDIIEPLSKGLILDKVGAKMQYGLVGDYVSTVVTGVECSIEDENAEVSDTTIPLSKLKPEPKRVSIAIPVSNTAIEQSDGLLMRIVQSQLPLALQNTLNKCMFDPAQSLKLKGCFRSTGAIKLAGKTPTWEEVLSLPAKVAAAGVKMDGACYVTNAANYYAMKATPIDAGSGRMMIEDGRIDGVPVFVTEYIGDYIGFGVFAYELVGQFGTMRMMIDPYTGAKKNLTYIVFNADFAMTSARPEAFVLAKPTRV